MQDHSSVLRNSTSSRSLLPAFCSWLVPWGENRDAAFVKKGFTGEGGCVPTSIPSKVYASDPAENFVPEVGSRESSHQSLS